MTVGERYGKRMGCSFARLFVDQDNEHAIAFYENKGYEIQEYVPLVHCYLMQKEFIKLLKSESARESGAPSWIFLFARFLVVMHLDMLN